ncbi:MAG: J domain-containing protein [Gemmataceae bacterium]|nr:J domain-containing protein [Gemmataceae bacterium]MDW8264337.1 DnaJ domain-containing protein [Gemmataceae bacterium]
MVNDPYSVLGVSADADDATIRERYVHPVREFPPEQHPDKFAAIRAAYEQLRDTKRRLGRRLFTVDNQESIEGLIEEWIRRLTSARLSLRTMLQAGRRK